MNTFPALPKNTLTLFAATLLVAQGALPRISAQSMPADPGELARFDANRNGRLDPEELAARDAVLGRATRSNVGEEAMVMSPFEVVSGDRGYHATNTMSGTRLNAKLED